MKIKNICCIGAGYVGGPTMAVIALKCPEIKVTLVDNNPSKIEAWNGDLDNLPVYEPGLKEIIANVRNKNLFFSSEIDNAIDKSEMIFMAVNTPTKTKGKGKGMAADLTHVENCAKNIARAASSYKIVVEKSTLPVRTAEKIKEILNSQGNGVKFEILSNPEFLAEGTAIQDLFKSDRVLIGSDSTKRGKMAAKALVEIYSRWIPNNKILTTNVWSSELSKLASNAMLAQRISSINSFSVLCEKTGAEIEEVSEAIGMDHRIGPKFLNASVGFGGSCFQKDILNLVYLCNYYGLKEVAEYWYQVVKINDYQKIRFANKIINKFNGNLQDKVICFLGWAFKKNTNDSRESASIYVAKKLLENGANIQVFDPMVKELRIKLDLKKLFEFNGLEYSEIENRLEKVTVYKNHNLAIKNSNAIAILTEWEEFIDYNWHDYLKKGIKIFDGRNLIKKDFKKTKNYFEL
ncbi:MAG: UDP-glucose 6-dehydrogenase [Flavobacteriaceae bacterium]|nr:UDP-glucose 6-dehydrogenase [Flavobacteriaceae bacterium]